MSFKTDLLFNDNPVNLMSDSFLFKVKCDNLIEQLKSIEHGFFVSTLFWQIYQAYHDHAILLSRNREINHAWIHSLPQSIDIDL